MLRFSTEAKLSEHEQQTMEHVLNQLPDGFDQAEVRDLLNYLSRDPPNYDDIIDIYQANPELIKVTLDSNGLYILHYSCWKDPFVFLVYDLIYLYPEALGKKTKQGKYPLHYACQFHQPETIIDALIKKYPQAIKEKDEDGCFPLHYACKTYQPLSVIKVLSEMYPQAIMKQDNNGYYPLTLAYLYGQTIEVIQFLTEMWPYALPIDITDESMSSSLTNFCNDDTTPCLVWKDPDSEEVRVTDGKEPMCDASVQTLQNLKNQLSVELPDWNNIIKLLIDSQEDLTNRSLDENGLYLLHYACWKHAPTHVTNYLIFK